MIKFNPNTNDAYNLLHQGTLAFARAERQGIRVDMEQAELEKTKLTNKINALESEFKSSKFYIDWERSTRSAINIDSNPQLATYLYKVKGITPDSTTKRSNKGSTNEESLKKLNIPEIDIMLKMRHLKKVRDTYLNAFIRESVNGFMHPNFNLNIPVTYRSSSSTPNFQNVPKRDKDAMKVCRGVLFPRKGHQLMEIDFSGAEVRIGCGYHKDKKMIKYMHDPTTNMHGDLAEQLFLVKNLDWDKYPEHKLLRQASKNGFVFPEFYGSYYKNCAKTLACKWGQLPDGAWKAGQGVPMPKGTLSDNLIAKGIKNIQAFTEHVKVVENDFWNVRFGEYNDWKDKWWAEYQKKGYFDMLTGFRCGGIMGKKDVCNYPFQGSSFHCLLWTFIQSDAQQIKKNWDSLLIGQIHDSIIIDTNPKERDYIIEIVQNIISKELPNHFKWINVPMEADIEIGEVDASWATMEKFEMA